MLDEAHGTVGSPESLNWLTKRNSSGIRRATDPDMEQPRHLCSQLVKLSWSGVSAFGSATANMEEISRVSAVLECEEPVPAAHTVEIRWDGILLAGRVSSMEKHEFGWRVEVELSPLTPWLPERGKPAHFLDIVEF